MLEPYVRTLRIQPERAGTLADAVGETERHLFVGRQSELGILERAFEDAANRPVVVYVHGPGGIGKTALLGAFARACRSSGAVVIRLEGQTLPPRGAAVTAAALRALAAATGAAVPATPGSDGLPLALSTVREGGRAVLLVIDDYDRLLPCDAELREQIFAHFGAGVAVVLSGRLPPERVWFGSPAWRAQVREIHLGGFTVEEASEYVRRVSGECTPVDPEAIRWTDGRPRWLAMIADAREGRPRSHRGTEIHRGPLPRKPAWGPFHVLERMLHPGSRRRCWRPGIGASALDKAVAAASLTWTFNRADLAAMTGARLGAEEWGRLVDLPFVSAAGDRYTIQEPVRSAIATFVERERPWAAGAWRRRGVALRLAQAAEAPDDPETLALHVWRDLSLLAAWAPWHARLYPPGADQYVCEEAPGLRGPELASVLAYAGLSMEEVEVPLRQLAGGPVLEILTVREGFRVAAAALLYRAGDSLETLVFVASPAEVAAGLIVRELCGRFTGCRQVVVGAAAGASAGGLCEVLELLGFREQEGLAQAPLGVDSQGRLTAWRLGLEPGGYAGWLRWAVAQPDRIPVPSTHAAAAKEALEALDRPGALETTFAAEYHAARFGSGGSEAVRLWLLDALREANLGPGSETRRALLTVYYVDHLGSHEAVAEHLNLSRPTYFRHHREALERLGRELFCPDFI